MRTVAPMVPDAAREHAALMQEIAERCLRRREELGMRQQDVADRARTSKQTVVNIEHAWPGINLRTLVKVAHALDTSPAWLMGIAE